MTIFPPQHTRIINIFHSPSGTFWKEIIFLPSSLRCWCKRNATSTHKIPNYILLILWTHQMLSRIFPPRRKSWVDDIIIYFLSFHTTGWGWGGEESEWKTDWCWKYGISQHFNPPRFHRMREKQARIIPNSFPSIILAWNEIKMR